MRNFRVQFLVALVAVLAFFSAANEVAENLVNYVNILSGTDSRYDLSHGGTLPFICRPWGFNHYAPQTGKEIKLICFYLFLFLLF